MSRPEYQAPPDIYYNETEATKYTSNTRIINVQSQMACRAIELLALPEDQQCFLLDVGCGSGLSGEELSDAGHRWVGMDISEAMLNVAVQREECDGSDVLLRDMGQGVPFRAGIYDGVISISAVQWLCHAYTKDEIPKKRLSLFFSSLYACMVRGARAVFQLYPEEGQIELITQCAMRAGFTGGVVVDYPNSSKAKKLFLCLFAGTASPNLENLAKTGEGDSDDDEPSHVTYGSVSRGKYTKRKGLKKSSREWIEEKKEKRRKLGKAVPDSTRFTGRKRKPKF